MCLLESRNHWLEKEKTAGSKQFFYSQESAFTPFQHIAFKSYVLLGCFLPCPDRKHLQTIIVFHRIENMWEKDKMLVTCILPFSHNVL